MLDTILTPRVLAVLGIIGLGLFAFSFAWAFFKVSYQKAVGKPVPRFWLTNACDVLAEIGANLPGAINRALKLAGKPGLFLPTAPADGSAPTASAATIDALSAELTRLRDALAAYQRRVNRRIDPGLAEVDYSDRFETRIYPVPAHGVRTIRLRMVSQFDPDAGYSLPLSVEQKIKRFKMTLDGEAKVLALPKGLSSSGRVIEAENVALKGDLAKLARGDRYKATVALAAVATGLGA
mgnify:CR=1 FL=1